MSIQENAINAALAEVIRQQGMHAVPEDSPVSVAERCDVQIRQADKDVYFTAVECKIGQSATQKKAAAKDAHRWYGLLPFCWNAISVCYPERMRTETQTSLVNILSKADDLLMARLNEAGVTRRWRKGGVAQIIELANDIEANETHAVTNELKKAIEAASANISIDIGRKLADALQLPWQPEGGGYDARPGLISCLIVANMALLENRMQSEGVDIKGLHSLIVIKDSKNKQQRLIENWRKIRAVDYAPVVDPALSILNTLPPDYKTEILLKVLINAVLECAPRIRGLQLDHAGPIYHGLLQTAKYDGSFYTSTSAAVLLAELAMPQDWPPMESKWNDIDKLSNLKICDPSCGTGTLLMAAARTLETRYKSVTGDIVGLPAIHKSLIENVLHGADINRHAIHLAASMMTISAPKIDYNKMNLYNMPHGVDDKKRVRAGSLDILTGNALSIPEISPTADNLGRSGFMNVGLQLENCDLVIINPPFTRNNIRHLTYPSSVRKKIQQHEIDIAKQVQDPIHKLVIHQTAAATFFIAIADQILNPDVGTLAMILPFTSCMNTAGKGYRKLMTNPERFHVDVVVTSHDNNRIYFSENTDIHECLIIASRATRKVNDTPTAFVSLGRNPSTASDAHFLAKAIRNAMKGRDPKKSTARLSDYGTIFYKHLPHNDSTWNEACFYNQNLAAYYNNLMGLSSLRLLANLASVGPAGRRVQDAFEQIETRQNLDMRAIWKHDSERQSSMQTSADCFIAPKEGKKSYAFSLWQRRSNLLIAGRLWLKTTKTPAIFAEESIIGSAFVPVTPNQSENRKKICKAWCTWLNSTLGVICFLNKRAKKLTYPTYSLELLRSLPVPDPNKCDLDRLAKAYDKNAKTSLLSLPEINIDSTRQYLDREVIASVPGIEKKDIPQLREAIVQEPSVTNSKDPFCLTE